MTPFQRDGCFSVDADQTASKCVIGSVPVLNNDDQISFATINEKQIDSKTYNFDRLFENIIPIFQDAKIGSAVYTLATVIRWAYDREVDPSDPSGAPVKPSQSVNALIDLIRHAISIDRLMQRQPSTSIVGGAKRFSKVTMVEQLMREELPFVSPIPELAAKVGVTVRTLQSQFLKERQMSPLKVQRRMRLEGCRDEILKITNQPISQIALRWGFNNLARFNAAYKTAFGEAAAETIARAKITILMDS